MCKLLLIALAFGHLGQAAPSPTIVSVTRIWDGGAHNAFTDLIRWRDRWYCTFREGDAHIGGDGRVRVLVSSDGEQWTSAAIAGSCLTVRWWRWSGARPVIYLARVKVR